VCSSDLLRRHRTVVSVLAADPDDVPRANAFETKGQFARGKMRVQQSPPTKHSNKTTQ